MQKRYFRALTALVPIVVLVVATAPARAQEEGGPPRPKAPAGPVPRAAGGKPDLQGYWNALLNPTPALEDTPGGAPMKRATKTVVSDPPDGKIPYLPWALAERNDRRKPENNYNDPDVHCMPPGTPRAMYDMALPILILQPAGHVVMLHEIMHAYRIIPVDGRGHLPATFPTRAGDSIGRWDGDVLVVDTINNRGEQWLGQLGDFLGAGAHVVERFAMADSNTINYTATIEDPKMFSRPWTITIPLGRNLEKGIEMLESACHEEDQDLAHLRVVHEMAVGGK